MAHMTLVNQYFNGTINYLHPLALATKSDNNNTYTVKEVLKQEDCAEFAKAMIFELNDNESRNHWMLLPKSSMPSSAKPILSI